MLPETGLTEAARVLERVRRQFADEMVVLGDGNSIAITVSIGVASMTPGKGVEAALLAADDALYRAKRSGRNRLCAVGTASGPVELSRAGSVLG